MKNSKGFTLIELLVVIAIIGILASVVLASLNSARSKGSDAAIQSSINNGRAQAELYSSSNSNSYDGVCDALSTANPGGILTMKQGAERAGSGAVTCNDATGAWALSAQLKADNTKYFCADSTGIASTTSTALGTNTVCP